MIEIPNVERDRLERRILFLRSRAEANLEMEPEDMHSKGCAATLFRDSASLGLLAGRIGKAREDLVRAGKLFLDLGLAEGAALVVLADAVNAEIILGEFSNVLNTLPHHEGQGASFGAEEQERPSSEGDRWSPYQWAALFQADLLLVKNGFQELDPDAGTMRSVPERIGAYQMGSTGLSIGTYVGLATWMVEERRSRTLYSPDRVLGLLRTLYTIRAENIRCATKDTYNWVMMLRPTELLDLDSVILMCLVLGDDELERELDGSLAEESQICLAPLIVARELTRSWRTKTG